MQINAMNMQPVAPFVGMGAPPAAAQSVQPQVSAAVPNYTPGAAKQGYNQYLNFLGYTNGDPTAAYQSYADSTGYNYAMDQGQRAITGSAAARGLLNSGATAKRLTKFGQDLGRQSFGGYLDRMNNYGQGYLSQLVNMNNILGGTASAGQNALGQIGSLGSAGGGNAASAITQGATNQGAAVMSGGNAMGSSISGAAGLIGNAFANLPQSSSGGFNLFG